MDDDLTRMRLEGTERIERISSSDFEKDYRNMFLNEILIAYNNSRYKVHEEENRHYN